MRTNEPSTKNKIVIIGGGYAGIKAIEHLSMFAENEIILIDKNPYHFMQTDVYDLIANEYDFAKVTTDLFTFCSGFDNQVTFLKQEVKHVDFKNKRVISDLQRISYDYLIIAVGARTKFLKSIEGLHEHAYGVKALHRALYLKQKFEMSLFKKVDKDGVSCTPLSIVVAGGGLSGVEIAAQMASFAREFYEQNHFLCRKLNIVLVNASNSILDGLDDYLVSRSEKRVLDLGINIINNAKVVKVTKESTLLSNGMTLYTDFLIFAGGIEPNGLVYALELSKDKDGYIQTNEYLQSVDFENIFAVGDCTSIYNSEGKKLAPTADIAEQMGILCAQNIMRDVQGQEMHKHTIKSRGMLIALGRNCASAKVSGLHLYGYVAYLLKKFVERMYAFSLDRRSKKGCMKIFDE